MADEPDLAKEVREASEAVAKAARTRSAEDAAKAADESLDVVRIGLARGWTWQAWLPVIIAVCVLSAVAYYAVPRTESPVAERKDESVKAKKVGDEADVVKVITDGFAGLGAKLDALGKKIDEKPAPVPVDPDKPKPPAPVKGISIPSTVNLSGGHVSIKAVSVGPVAWFAPAYSDLTIDTIGDVAIVSSKTGSSGTYWIGATTVVDGKIVPPVYCAVTVNQGPQPPPKPDPSPDPKPAPKVDSLSIVVIYESADTNGKTAKVVADYVFWESLKPLGVKWFKIDKDQKDAHGSLLVDSHNYRQYMDKHGIPCLLFMDGAGLVVRAIPLPDSTATIRANVTQLMGR